MIGNKVSSISVFENNSKRPESSPIVKMFMYLGLVESLGVAFINLIMLLLITCGSDFHIEQHHHIPRIIHAETIEDLQSTSIGLSSKVEFLKNNGLTRTSKLVNTDLRNKIAHLNLSENEIDENGVISKNFQINIKQKYDEFNKTFNIIRKILNEVRFWEDFL